VEKHYYVDLPPPVLRSHWGNFEHELSFPVAVLGAHFSEVEGDSGRTRVTLRAEQDEQTDEAMRRFRLFLASRGVVRLEPPLR